MKLRIYTLFLSMFMFSLLFTACGKGKTIEQVVKEGETSYMPGIWDVSFKTFSSENPDSCFEEIKMTATISNPIEAHNTNASNDVELVKYDADGKKTEEEMSFEDFLSMMKGFDEKYLSKHDLVKLEREHPEKKYSLKGTGFAVRESKSNDYDEIVAKQVLIIKGKGKTESRTILFEMEKRIKTNLEGELYE